MDERMEVNILCFMYDTSKPAQKWRINISSVANFVSPLEIFRDWKSKLTRSCIVMSPFRWSVHTNAMQYVYAYTRWIAIIIYRTRMVWRRKKISSTLLSVCIWPYWRKSRPIPRAWLRSRIQGHECARSFRKERSISEMKETVEGEKKQ